MATIYAIANGNWSDGSTWSTGNVPTVDDDVWLNNHIVNVTTDNPSIEAKNISNKSYNNNTIQAGGYLNVTSTVETTINANLEGEENLNLLTFVLTNIVVTGNCTNAWITSNGNGSPSFTVRGNTDTMNFTNTSGGGSHKNMFYFYGDVRNLYISTSRTTQIFIYGNLYIDRPIRSANWERTHYLTLNGNSKLVISGNYILNEFNDVSFSDCTIDISESNYSFPIAPRGNIIISNNINIIYNQPKESDVKLGVIYGGNRVGTFAPIQGTIVNLTEQEVKRVKNCATVSTVQKCFEDFKE